MAPSFCSSKLISCQYCGQRFASDEGVNRHIAHAPECKREYNQEVLRRLQKRPQYDVEDPQGLSRLRNDDIQDRPDSFYEGDGVDFGDDYEGPQMAMIGTAEELGDEAEVLARLEDLDGEEDERLSPSDTETLIEDGEVEETLDSSQAPENELHSSFRQPHREFFPGAGRVYDEAETTYEKRRSKEKWANQSPWDKMIDGAHFELAEWILTSGISKAAIDSLFKLNLVSPYAFDSQF